MRVNAILGLTLLRHRARRESGDKQRATECVNRAVGLLVAVLLFAVPLLAPHSAATARAGQRAQRLQTLYAYGVDTYVAAVGKLARAPGGFKLHPTLAAFLGTHLAHAARLHTSLCAAAASHVLAWLTALAAAPLWARSLAACVLGCVGAVLGVSGLLDAAADVLALAHAHLLAARAALALTWRGTRRALQCLWRLFRGLKWNPLRARVDSCRFALDELLAGTLLFVLLCCLAPTVLAHHVLACVAAAPVLTATALLSAVARVFQAFPVSRAIAWILRDPSIPRVTVYTLEAPPSSGDSESSSSSRSPVLVKTVCAHKHPSFPFFLVHI